MEGSHGKNHGNPENRQSSTTVELLDMKLLDQNGKPVQFKTEAIGENIVVMNFIYTTCTTQCPLNSQILSHVEKNLSQQEREQVRLVSLSVDPGIDTPQRLKNYAEKIGAGPGWTWLTGYRPEVNQLLNALGVYTPDFKTHPSVVLVGDGKTGNWTRFYGTPGPDQLLAKVHELMALRDKDTRSTLLPVIRRVSATNINTKSEDSRARAYFTDLPVVTHDGKQLRFYTDLLKDKVVLINLFYGKCENSCPMVHSKLSKLQTLLKDYMGKSVFFVSITIDPEPDTPEALAQYAKNFKPGEGWTFVTGNPAHIKTITKKLGQVHDQKEGHAPFLMVGDVKRARWRKIMPNVPDDKLADFLRTLASDSSS
jgi:cytochrome oxidase Cu insertion factor (SCO1/SenC/PrrC family)